MRENDVNRSPNIAPRKNLFHLRPLCMLTMNGPTESAFISPFRNGGADLSHSGKLFFCCFIFFLFFARSTPVLRQNLLVYWPIFYVGYVRFGLHFTVPYILFIGWFQLTLIGHTPNRDTCFFSDIIIIKSQLQPLIVYFIYLRWARARSSFLLSLPSFEWKPISLCKNLLRLPNDTEHRQRDCCHQSVRYARTKGTTA